MSLDRSLFRNFLHSSFQVEIATRGRTLERKFRTASSVTLTFFSGSHRDYIFSKHGAHNDSTLPE
ncbi:MAG: hypothetical protein K8U03_20795 [Planctomycetia bacterium]|nr:hypothetical protein [Planctomycetia bacterium]